jgi:hypothetical protein
LNLQLPVQSVPITTKVVRLNPTRGRCELNAVFVSDLRQGMSVVFPTVLRLHLPTKLTVKVESGVKHNNPNPKQIVSLSQCFVYLTYYYLYLYIYFECYIKCDTNCGFCL